MPSAPKERELIWELERPEDRKRWWVRDQQYTLIPRTPLSDSVITKEWDEAVICIGDVLKFPDSRGFNARTVNGYTFLSPMQITDPQVIKKRLAQFLSVIEEMSRDLDGSLSRYHEEQEGEQAFWRTADLTTFNLMTLLEYWRRVLITMDRFWKLHFLIVFPRHVVAGMFEQAARELAGVKDSHQIGKLTQSHGMTRQIELDISLWALAARAIDLGLKEMFLETEEKNLVDCLQVSNEGTVWLKEFDIFLQRFGSRMVLPLELYDASWIENPVPVLGTLRSYIAQGGSYNFERLLNQMSVERVELIKNTLQRIADPTSREKFKLLLERARKFQQAMEDDNYYFLWAGYQVRKVALAIGQHLQDAGVLESATDVFFLRREQMEQALVDLASGMYDLASVKVLASTQKAEWESWRKLQPPSYIGNLPDEIHDFMINDFWGIRGRKQLDETGKIVSGVGASAGIAIGIAHHVHSAEEFGKVAPGEIIICRSTNPAWTPVFSKIAAIVTDQGGTLSHSAIVAREYGIPAVLGTIHATTRIPDGARIRVDGGTGKVEIL